MPRHFGKTAIGEDVYLFTLRNTTGMEVAITNYGATIVSLKVPDRNGNLNDVVLGYDDLQSYLADYSQYLGATIGRYANRIAKGRFTLNGQKYSVPVNNGPNSLHGGLQGFDKRLWLPKVSSDDRQLVFHYGSKDGEEGFPGNLNVDVLFQLSEDNELQIDYSATTDRDTPVNLTNHCYFNLAGAGNGDILQHEVKLFASRFTPVDENLIPTGEIRSVTGTPFDFRESTAIGAYIENSNEQLKRARGYDHNFVLDTKSPELVLAARVAEPNSGRILEVLTTEPGIQFYTGNFLNDGNKGKNGKIYSRRYGLCLETQHFPDSPNHPTFPSTILKANQKFRSRTVYRFS